MNRWFVLNQKYGTWPTEVVFPYRSEDEQQVLSDFGNESHDTESVRRLNGRDPLTHDFLESLKFGINGCGLEKWLQSHFPANWKYLNENAYKVRIISVPFPLCADSGGDCTFESSFVAKNFPGRKVILVNAFRWNMLQTDEKAIIAVHEFMGIVRLEEGSYGLSSRIRFDWVQQGHLSTLTCFFAK